jgi:hypothetical protein
MIVKLSQESANFELSLGAISLQPVHFTVLRRQHEESHGHCSFHVAESCEGSDRRYGQR